MDNMMFVLAFFRNIRYLRTRYGLTKKQMADILGIGVKSLSLMEQEVLPPRLSSAVLLRAATYFEIPLKDLFFDLEIS